MKILLIVRWPVGGIRTYIRYVYRSFDPEKWRLTILAPDISEMRVLITDLAGLNVRFIPIEENPSPVSYYMKVTSTLMRERYDLVHSHGFTSAMAMALPAFLRRTPHLMTSHDILNIQQFAGLKGWCKHLGMAWLFGLIDLVHSVSNDAQENLFEYFPSLSRKNGKCVVIPNGIEVERFVEAEPRDLRGELGLDENVFLIGFLGRFMSQKGFRYLVDAIELLRANEFLPKRPLVLTFGDGGFIREEKQAVQERGLEDNFVFMPFTPNVAGTIKGLDVVIMPSIWEACGLLAMETLVCGVPLIGSNCIGLREVLKGTPAIVVEKADAADLARALVQEMEMSSRESFLNFRETAKKMFDIRKTSQTLENIYDRMTNFFNRRIDQANDNRR
jgi:glycosyltransferase involved in cell wall biosynthesis